jgi:hypothetical protein
MAIVLDGCRYWVYTSDIETTNTTGNETMATATLTASSDIPVYRRRHTIVTVWNVSTGKPVATGTLTHKLKNGIRIIGCHEGLGVEQDLSVKTYLDGKYAFTWE